MRKVHAEFADLGPYSRHAVDTAGLTPEEVVLEITDRKKPGEFALDLRKLRSAGAA